MKYQRLPLLILFLLTFFTAATAQTEKPAAKPESKTEAANSGILLFRGSSFMLAAPKNWVMDSQSGAGAGLPAVFYPQGSSWSQGKAVMYANVWVKTNPAQETLEKVIEVDVKAFKDRSDKLKVTDGEALATSKSDKKATVKYFTGDPFGNHEAIAYIDEGKTVSMIVLSSRTREDFEKSLAAFKELVGSYFFLTGNVKIEK
jgi:hypothetical protein